MQECTVEVALGGDKTNTVVRTKVTPPEVLILQRIHGKDSVEFRGETDEKKHVHVTEIQRLREKYHVKDPMGNAGIPVFDVLFPGAAPNLPLRFSDIGFGREAMPTEVRVLPDKIATASEDDSPKPVVAKKAAKKSAKKAAKKKAKGSADEEEEEEEPASNDGDDWPAEVTE